MIRKCYKFYTLIMTLMWVMAAMTASAFAVDDMWTVANRIIVEEHVLDLLSNDGGWYMNDVPDDILSVVPSFSGKIGYICEYE